MNHFPLLLLRSYLVGDKLRVPPYAANLDSVKMPAETQTPPQPGSYHHGNLRTALIDEASRVLESDGVEALSLRRLAKQLGVSHAAPGHHFANRAELLAELAADGFGGLADAMEEAMAISEPPRWLTETGKAYVRFALAHPQRYRLMFASQLMTGDCPTRLLDESSRAFTDLLTAVHRGIPPGSAATSRMNPDELGAWSIVHGAVMLWLDGQLGSVGSEERFLELTDSVLESSF